MTGEWRLASMAAEKGELARMAGVRRRRAAEIAAW
jgi:hypothetical protein